MGDITIDQLAARVEAVNRSMMELAVQVGRVLALIDRPAGYHVIVPAITPLRRRRVRETEPAPAAVLQNNSNQSVRRGQAVFAPRLCKAGCGLFTPTGPTHQFCRKPNCPCPKSHYKGV